jgi:glutamine amidotransferase
MCELFAMSSRMPTAVDFSLERLTRRGGAEGPHRDGWGVAFYTGRDALLLREPGAASESSLVRHIESHGPPSELVISHIRLASFGVPALRNTQPFGRELGGHVHVFAHNGDLPAIVDDAGFALGRFLPIGETDSEYAFCHLLARLTTLWDGAGGAIPTLDARLQVIADFATDLRGLGSANFLYTDSDTLFVHAHRRTLPDSDQVLPGLFVLERSCEEEVPDLSGSGVRLETVQQALTLIASVPLTDESWEVLAPGELLAVRAGSIIERRSSSHRTT